VLSITVNVFSVVAFISLLAVIVEAVLSRCSIVVALGQRCARKGQQS
jgi:hypothetical protein|tara:strand:- start:7007 stop:7147 length:141 start_codon:yes stop_codon:yes gene_type:complete